MRHLCLTTAPCTCCCQDGGGITSDGGLPPVQPLYIGSERELRTELERITATLSRGAVDWEKR